MMLNNVSYSENTRPRNSSSTVSCTVVSTQILAPCAASPSRNAPGTRVCITNGRPRATWVTQASASMPVIQAGLPICRATGGVTTAATSAPAAVSANTWPSPEIPARNTPWSWKWFRYSSRVAMVHTP